MNLTDLFKRSLDELRSLECTFAVGGGFAADLYRKQERGTGDIDFLFIAEEPIADRGREILQKLGFKVGEARLHNLTRSPQMNKKNQPIYILVGRTDDENEPGVDLLLPSFPWFEKALARAQSNLVDFGFGPTPTMTVEDILLAKMFAKRLKDVDDIISIFERQLSLDLEYLAGEMERLKFVVPDDAIVVTPKALKILTRRRKKNRDY